MQNIVVYLNGKYHCSVAVLAIPIPGDRLVLDDPYQGYIVDRREIKPREIVIYCREDK